MGWQNGILKMDLGKGLKNVKKTLIIIGCVLFICVGFFVEETKVIAEDMDISTNRPGLQVGSSAPDFTGVAYAGNKVGFSNLYKKGPVVLIFYRGAWCPYCNLHLRAFQERLKDFNALGVTLLAVSVDKPDYAAKTVKDNALGFEVISNPEAEILESYHVLYRVSDDLAAKYLKEYRIDLEAHSGRKDHVIAIPATYAIDKTGKIIFSYANEDYKVRTPPQEIIDFLMSAK